MGGRPQHGRSFRKVPDEPLGRLVLTEGQPSAQVNFNSGLSLSLARQAGIGGLRYGQSPYEFHATMTGGEATMFNQGRPVRCRIR